MEKNSLKIVFMGTPEFAVGTLSSLVENNYNVVGVVTQPDKPVGRHHEKLQPPAVKVYAQEHGIRVLQPEKLKDEAFISELKSFDADIFVVVAFRMLPKLVWDMPRYGTFNVHAALLPQYRGAAPINWAIINGEKTTGVTTFFLDENIDTGRIILRKEFDIPEDADVEYVYDGLMELGAKAAIETLELIKDNNGRIDCKEQDTFTTDGVSLKTAPKIFKDTCRIDWNQSALSIHNFVRGLSPIPGAWTNMGSNGVLKIYKTRKTGIKASGKPGTTVMDKHHIYVNCTDEQLEILTLQPSGKKRMDGASFINGIRNNDAELYMQ